MPVAELKLDLIRIDGGTQARAKINQDTVAEYAEYYLAKVDMPPVVVYFDGADHWLADGFHRFHGASRAGLTKIPVESHKGTQQEAVLYACKANAAHGLKRTNADKRKAVEMLLEIHSDWSDRRIAEHCGVGNALASEVRQLFESNSRPEPDESATDEPEDTIRFVHEESQEPQPRIGRDGKKRKPPKNKPKPEPATPTKPAKGKPVIDLRKFAAFESHIGKAIRMNTEIKEHCGGADYHEKIRQHMNESLKVLATWRKHSGAV